MKLRVYIDASVVYGAPSKEFSQDSQRFWEAFRNDEFILIVSDVLEEEIERAPQSVRDRFEALPESRIERVISTVESNKLAMQYITENVVGTSNLDDCRHIAIATICKTDAFVSWNFKHMIYRRAGYNDINEMLGHSKIAIQTPKKFMEASNDEI
ncbi:MAG: hypothetical protein FWC43_02880 [Planctomycetaceae bacterium]|nr:hypothetical protein [Planctomycetaceae bacterium]